MTLSGEAASGSVMEVTAAASVAVSLDVADTDSIASMLPLMADELASAISGAERIEASERTSSGDVNHSAVRC
jgi:hypothetical protein